MKTLLSAPPTDRVGRYPKHTFYTGCLPFVIQPFLLARVLPGETLSNVYMEARSVARGCSSPIVGWKQQYFLCYVKATDLALDAFREMFTDPTNADLVATTALEDADGNAATYASAGGIDWTLRALQKVTEALFRDEGEAWDYKVDSTSGLPIAQIREESWLDSLSLASNMPEGEAIASATDMGDLERLMDAFEALRAMGIANMSYEDWLRSQGISVPEVQDGKPELLELWSEFTYPVNTIDPATGTPSSAVSWVWKKSSKNRKFFKEPGFLIGVQVTRPKVYLAGLTGSLAGFATRAWDWMPNYLRAMPETSLKPFGDLTGPAPTITADYVVDMRDDLTHGDQFVSFGNGGAYSSDVGNHFAGGPGTTGVWKYPTQGNIAAFCDSVQTDGMVSLNIKGFEQDYTQGNFALEGG